MLCGYVVLMFDVFAGNPYFCYTLYESKIMNLHSEGHVYLLYYLKWFNNLVKFRKKSLQLLKAVKSSLR